MCGVTRDSGRREEREENEGGGGMQNEKDILQSEESGGTKKRHTDRHRFSGPGTGAIPGPGTQGPRASRGVLSTEKSERRQADTENMTQIIHVYVRGGRGRGGLQVMR